MPDCGCQNYDLEFDQKVARRDLAAYRRRGPGGSTKTLIDALESEGVAGLTVLDIGGGVGAVHLELLAAGAARAIDVDASAAYVEAAKEEAARRGYAQRVDHRYGDFAELADEIGSCDIVALDRVVCCYPDMPRLIRLSVARAERLFGIVHPRETWWTRLGIGIENWFRRRGNGTQFFVHPVAAMDRAIRDAGFEPRFEGRTIMWRIAVYARTGADRRAGATG
jgi:magnesium-protoporphyrin O-methyltransferase